MIFFPPCDLSHIPGSLDLVTLLAEDLEIIPGPLVPTHRDRPDVIQYVVMMHIRTFSGVEFMDLLSAPGTLASLVIPDKLPHIGDRRPLFEPVLHTAGRLAADGMLIFRIEGYSLAATMGTGPPGETLLLFRSIPAVFAHNHVQASHSFPPLSHEVHPVPGPDNEIQGWMNVTTISVSFPIIRTVTVI